MTPNVIRITPLRAFVWAGCLCVALTFSGQLRAQDALYQQGLRFHCGVNCKDSSRRTFCRSLLTGDGLTVSFNTINQVSYTSEPAHIALGSEGSVDAIFTQVKGSNSYSSWTHVEPNEPFDIRLNSEVFSNDLNGLGIPQREGTFPEAQFRPIFAAPLGGSL